LPLGSIRLILFVALYDCEIQCLLLREGYTRRRMS